MNNLLLIRYFLYAPLALSVYYFMTCHPSLNDLVVYPWYVWFYMDWNRSPQIDLIQSLTGPSLRECTYDLRSSFIVRNCMTIVFAHFEAARVTWFAFLFVYHAERRRKKINATRVMMKIRNEKEQEENKPFDHEYIKWVISIWSTRILKEQ